MLQKRAGAALFVAGQVVPRVEIAEEGGDNGYRRRLDTGLLLTIGTAIEGVVKERAFLADGSWRNMIDPGNSAIGKNDGDCCVPMGKGF